MNAVTQTQFAGIIENKKSYVSELKKAGRLVLNSQGRVLVKESLLKIEETKDPSKQGVVDRHKENRGKKQPSQPSPKYQDSRAKKEHFAALKAEIEHKQLVGGLLERESIKHSAAGAGVLVRNRLESLADVMAPQLAVEQDEAKVRAMLIDQIEFILTELERSFKGLVVASG